jgi:hypothetical protein
VFDSRLAQLFILFWLFFISYFLFLISYFSLLISRFSFLVSRFSMPTWHLDTHPTKARSIDREYMLFSFPFQDQSMRSIESW